MAKSLEVRLGLASKNFESGIKRAQGSLQKFVSSGNKMQKVGAVLKTAFNAIKIAAVAAAAAIAAGAAALVKFGGDFLRAADNIAKTAKSIGVSAEALTGLQHAAELSGVGLPDLSKSMGRLARVASDAGHGLATAERSFETIGVTFKDTAGNLKPMEELLLDVADAFQQMPDGVQKAAVAQELFGRGGVKLIPLLNEGRDGIKKMTDEAERLGLVLGGKVTQDAERFNDNMDRVKKIFTGFRNIIFSELVGPLADASDAFFKWASSGDNLRRVAENVASAILTLGRGIVSFGRGVANFFGQIKAVFDQIKLELQFYGDDSISNIEKVKMLLLGTEKDWQNYAKSVESTAEANAKFGESIAGIGENDPLPDIIGNMQKLQEESIRTKGTFQGFWNDFIDGASRAGGIISDVIAGELERAGKAGEESFKGIQQDIETITRLWEGFGESAAGQRVRENNKQIASEFNALLKDLQQFSLNVDKLFFGLFDNLFSGEGGTDPKVQANAMIESIKETFSGFKSWLTSENPFEPIDGFLASIRDKVESATETIRSKWEKLDLPNPFIGILAAVKNLANAEIEIGDILKPVREAVDDLKAWLNSNNPFATFDAFTESVSTNVAAMVDKIKAAFSGLEISNPFEGIFDGGVSVGNVSIDLQPLRDAVTQFKAWIEQNNPFGKLSDFIEAVKSDVLSAIESIKAAFRQLGEFISSLNPFGGLSEKLEELKNFGAGIGGKIGEFFSSFSNTDEATQKVEKLKTDLEQVGQLDTEVDVTANVDAGPLDQFKTSMEGTAQAADSYRTAQDGANTAAQTFSSSASGLQSVWQAIVTGASSAAAKVRELVTELQAASQAINSFNATAGSGGVGGGGGGGGGFSLAPIGGPITRNAGAAGNVVGQLRNFQSGLFGGGGGTGGVATAADQIGILSEQLNVLSDAYIQAQQNAIEYGNAEQYLQSLLQPINETQGTKAEAQVAFNSALEQTNTAMTDLQAGASGYAAAAEQAKVAQDGLIAQKDAMALLGQQLLGIADTIGSALGTALGSLITGTEKASDVWKKFAQTVIQALVQMIAKMLVAYATQKLLGGVLGGFSGGVSGGGIGLYSGFGGPITRGASQAQNVIGQMRAPVSQIPARAPSGADGGLNVQVNNYASDDVQVKARKTEEGLTIDMVRKTIAGDIRRGGNPVSGAMESTYGARRVR